MIHKLAELPIVQNVVARLANLPLQRQRDVLIMAVAGLFGLLALIYLFVSATVIVGFLASVLTGLATGLGALPVILFKRVPAWTVKIMMGWAAGIMLAATAFSLIIPGIHYGNQLWPGSGIYVVAAGMLSGAVFLDLADRLIPYEKFILTEQEFAQSARKVWLFVIAITIHNYPEGVAVGVSFGSEDWQRGTVLALAVALQNIPEGLAVALPLIGMGYNARKAAFVATLTGLVEPFGGLLGVTSVKAFVTLLPIGMGFAAGAMLFVVADHIIPEAHANGRARSATFGIMAGFILMMILDNLIT
jgi:ZIP family zinc transporter